MRYIPPYVRKMMQEEINNGNLSYNDLGETAKQTLTPPPKPKNTNPGSGNFKQLEEQQLREQASTPSYSFLTPTREAVAPPSMADFRRLDNEWVDNNKTFLEEEIESGRMNPQFAEKHPIIATGVAGLGRALTPIAELVAPDPVDKPSLRNINPRIRQEATNIMLGINEPLPETGTPWADIPSSMVGFGLGLMSGGGVNGVKSVGNIALRGGDEILQSTPQIAAKLATKTDKLTPLGQKIAKGAVGGATGGAGFGLMEGMSEGLSPTDTAKRMATDALMFGGMEAGMPLVGAGLKSASKTLGKGAFPVKEEVGQALDKSAVKNTPLKPSAVAEDMNSNTINIEEALNTVERQIGGNKGNTDYKTIESINSYSDIKNNVNIPEKVKQAYTKVVDRFDRLKDVDNHIDSYMKKTTGKGLSESEKLYKLGTNSTSAEGIAQQIMEKHLLDSQGNVVGKSFNEVIKGVADTVGKDNWRVFEDYNKLKHAMSWMRKGREVYPEEAGLSEPVKRIKQTWEQIKKTQKDKTLNKQQKEYVVKQLKKDIDTVASEIETGFINPRLAKIEQQIPSIKQASKDYNNWIAKFGEEWGVKTGLINPEEWALLRKEYPDYVPLQRVMDEIEEGLMGAKSGFANQVKPIKKGRGSERDTVESIEVMIERIPQYVKTAKRNEVAQNLYKMIQRNPEEMADAWGKVIEVKPGDPRKPNIITARVNGKEVSMELNDPALLDAMAHLSKKGQDIVTETVRKATGIMKTLTTGVNPFFSIGRNVFYDMPQAYQNSKTLRNFKGVNDPIQFSVDLMDSLVRIITNEKWHKEKYLQMYRDMGGGGFTSASAADRNLLAESKAKIMPGYIDAKKPLTSAGRLVQKGYGDLQRLMSVTETLPRLPEFKRAVQQGGGTYDSKIKGLYEANDITFNFSRHGEVSKFLDAYIPFFNAAVQGLDKEARAFKDNPVGKTANAIISVTIPTLLLYSINHDNPAYQQVSEATKSRYYLLPKEDGTFTKIVKPRESGTIFGTALEDMLDYMKDNDPKVFESFMLGIKNNFLPPVRSIAAPALSDLRSNKDFADRPIVPGYMQGLSPELQYDANTSEPAKWLGKKTGISPKQIDFLARSYGGIVAQLGQPLTTEGVDLKETVKRQFVADPLYSNDVFSNFYEEVDRLDTSYKDSKSLGTPEPERKKRLAFNKVVTKLSDIRKKMRLIENNKTLDPEVKQEKLRKMQSEMINQAKIIQEKYKKTK